LEVCKACGSNNPPVANFCSVCGAALHNRRDMARASGKSLGASGERRPLTIMFCDLVGSTELSSRLDPEELGALIRDYQKRIGELVREFGGFIAQFLGDGILAYFGWPVASETDAERAIRCGLAASAAISAVRTETQALRIRIGIATGIVVVGEPIGTGQSFQQPAMGVTPNLAARLQSLAEPGTVVIDAATRRQIGNLFDLRPLGPVVLKGLPGPVDAFEVRSVRKGQTRFEALHAPRLTRRVDRGGELEILRRQWKQAVSGHGQVVLVSGEPGIGKSRLLIEFDAEQPTTTVTRFRYYCSPHHQDIPFYPVRGQIAAASGFAYDDAVAVHLTALREFVGPLGLSQKDLASLASLMGIPDLGVSASALSPEERKAQTIEALVRVIEQTSERTPLLLVFEDAHWADPSTLEFIGKLIPRLLRRRVLLVMTFRPEFEPPWAGQAGVSTMILDRLGHDDAASLVVNATVHFHMKPPLIDLIVAKSDGNALFLEELTAAAVEAAPKDLHESAAISVPSTLQASLLSRLDRLGSSKEVAQLGSVLGREFPFALLAALTGAEVERLVNDLGVLVHAQILLPPDSTRNVYKFKHALIYEAAYESLLLGRRRQLHGQVAEILETAFPDMVHAQPGLLERHYAEAGCFEAATRWSLRAAEQNIRRFANLEAVGQLRRALAMLSQLPEDQERDELEVEVRTTLGIALAGTSVYASQDWHSNTDRVLEVAGRIGANDRLLPVLWQKWRFVFSTCDNMQSALALARDVLAIAERIKEHEPGATVVAHRILGMSLVACGDFVSARHHLEYSLAEFKADEHAKLTYVFAFDQRLVAMAYLALALVQAGSVDEGRRMAEQVRKDAIVRDHATTTALVLSVRLGVYLLLRDWEALRNAATDLLHLLKSYRHRGREVLANSILVMLHARETGVKEDLAVAVAGIDELRLMNWRFWVPWLLMMAAEVHLCHGRPGEAGDLLDELDTLIASTGYALLKSDVCLIRASLMAATSQPAIAVESQFRLAVDTAREQGAALAEARASTSLARYRRDPDRFSMVEGRHVRA
jgi:class 3 adenylate cyclase